MNDVRVDGRHGSYQVRQNGADECSGYMLITHWLRVVWNYTLVEELHFGVGADDNEEHSGGDFYKDWRIGAKNLKCTSNAKH